ncbi:MAG: hypothetical protein H7834_15235 [Magnetococcus sp. YQC-9]
MKRFAKAMRIVAMRVAIPLLCGLAGYGKNPYPWRIPISWAGGLTIGFFSIDCYLIAGTKTAIRKVAVSV